MRWTKFQPKRELEAQTRALCDALVAEEDSAPGAKISERGWTIVREIESHGWYVMQSKEDPRLIVLHRKPDPTHPAYGMCELTYGAPEGPRLSAHARAEILAKYPRSRRVV